MRVKAIREIFQKRLADKKFVGLNREGTMTDLVGNTVIEIIGASFVADEDSIFGEVNLDYVQREEQWYNSMSRNVNDIPGGAPAIWKAVADRDGIINSNYGWMIYSQENGNQYENVARELKSNPLSRRAEMIYNRPTMWTDYNHNGRSDFCCTNAVHYVIRNEKLHCVVQMRSNDAVFGYKGDRAWQKHVLEKLGRELNIEPGTITWQVNSLHIYARHYYLVDPLNYSK
jgi:thymidylate synthase